MSWTHLEKSMNFERNYEEFRKQFFSEERGIIFSGK